MQLLLFSDFFKSLILFSSCFYQGKDQKILIIPAGKLYFIFNEETNNDECRNQQSWISS